ncbi:helix-turn-helix domain-containing protein [Flammeovirga sp. SJP92]|uniref:helix-turn-helix domain-containing protein n=1 Tax=Flammeovirga sp. SJP92 TaxID=1775430 RepID=UPI000786F1B9|nr:helix-turn-helix transcriptional regulator [Flammeovirga sp. SJP92]KXX72743.1 hypothetical protein AVL50_32095 [Flammeovirga sp. SJP92]
MRQISEVIKEVRKKEGVSAKVIAEKLNLERPNYYRFEKKFDKLQFELFHLIETLGISLKDFFTLLVGENLEKENDLKLNTKSDSHIDYPKLIYKLSKFGKVEVCKDGGEIFTLLMTGKNLANNSVLMGITCVVVDMVSKKYPTIDIMKNDDNFQLMVLRK